MSTMEVAPGVHSPRRRALILGLPLGIGALAAGYVVSRAVYQPPDTKPDGLLWPNPKRLSGFSLSATDGKNLDVERLRGRWSFLFFGYTFCPDVCPTTLVTMKTALNRLRDTESAGDVQVVFVSVDPARDTLDRMKQYVEYFDASFIGATGPLDRG